MDWLKEAVEDYRENLKAALAFALLLVFVLPALWMHELFFSSATVFLSYRFNPENLVGLVPALVTALLFLFFYSVFVTLMVFAVRKKFSHIQVHYYLSEKIHKFAVKLFVFYVGVLFAFYAVTALAVAMGWPAWPLNLVWAAALTALMFVPQAIVVDEANIRASVEKAWQYALARKGNVLRVWLVGLGLALALLGIEFALDSTIFIGKHVAVVLALVFVVPFLEIVKTLLYMQKFDLIRRSHRLVAPAAKMEPASLAEAASKS